MIAGVQTTALSSSTPSTRSPGFGSMTDAEFQRWVELLEDRTGVVVPPERRQFLETNLRLRIQELEFSSFSTYFARKLVGPQGAQEWSVLIDRRWS